MNPRTISTRSLLWQRGARFSLAGRGDLQTWLDPEGLRARSRQQALRRSFLYARKKDADWAKPPDTHFMEELLTRRRDQGITDYFNLLAVANSNLVLEFEAHHGRTTTFWSCRSEGEFFDHDIVERFVRLHNSQQEVRDEIDDILPPLTFSEAGKQPAPAQALLEFNNIPYVYVRRASLGIDSHPDLRTTIAERQMQHIADAYEVYRLKDGGWVVDFESETGVGCSYRAFLLDAPPEEQDIADCYLHGGAHPRSTDSEHQLRVRQILNSGPQHKRQDVPLPSWWPS